MIKLKSNKKPLLIVLTILTIIVVGIAFYIINTGSSERIYSQANAELSNIKSIEVNGERSYTLIGYDKASLHKSYSLSKITSLTKIDTFTNQYEYSTESKTDNESISFQLFYSADSLIINSPETGWSKIDKQTASENNIPIYFFDVKKVLEKLVLQSFTNESRSTFKGEEDLNNRKVYSYDVELSDAESKLRSTLLTNAFFEEYLQNSNDIKIKFDELKYNIKIYKDSNKIAQQTLIYAITFDSPKGKLVLTNGRDVINVVNINQNVVVDIPETSK